VAQGISLFYFKPYIFYKLLQYPILFYFYHLITNIQLHI